MGQKCGAGNHLRCDACDTQITPEQRDHIHIFRGGGHKDDTLCGTCWLLCAIASTHLLNALKDCGVTTNNPIALRNFLRLHVGIYVDQPFTFEIGSLN